MRYAFCLLALLTGLFVAAQETSIYNDDPMQKLPLGMEHAEYKIRKPTGKNQVKSRVEPPNWYVGMVEPKVELLIHERDVARFSSASLDYPGVRVDYLRKLENPNYLFLGLHINQGADAGAMDITLQAADGARKTLRYELLPHPGRDRDRLSQKDFIYLIMPDRFANGDPTNDSVEGMAQQGVNREKFLFRHGGDLAGIEGKLDYLADLGVTALWLNPVLENDQPYESYHGYAVTDHYRIDRRFGSNDTYKQLVEAAHERGIKVIMDVIFNHVGDHHWFIEDLPSNDWIHQWPEYTQTTYRATTLLDPNAAEADKKRMLDGWFDKHMPDLNQENPHLARYLIQNSIWWTLYSGQDGYRIDTYAYPDQKFMTEWNRRLLEEFPDLGIFGETWVHGPGVQSYFVNSTGLPGVTDFQLYYAIHEAMHQEPGWTDGVMRIYYTLAQDYLYERPEDNVIFLDNHDIARLFTSLNQDMTKMKSALALLMTLRGIPMINSGTEMAFEGAGGGFGEGGRIDFPGGFAGDKTDLFNETDRSGDQRELHDYLSRLANWRKSSKAVTEGKLIQFVPVNGVYTFFRHHGEERVMVIFNGSDKKISEVDLSGFADQLRGISKMQDVTRNIDLTVDTKVDLAPRETRIFTLE